MARHLLSDLKVKNAKAGPKPYRLADGGAYSCMSPPRA
jgi:hypothetical protein